MSKFDPNRSLLLVLDRAEHGEPLDLSEDDLRARFAAIVRQARAERGWSENQRGECRRIAAALEAKRARA